ncbi:hypothetical protein B0H16DRAFT_1805044 [Mycena metata]|uniref:Uncharacterized protein n=1 Tax=Mycena metata TaxID=1033252 RepID=A0AAD7H9G6_9AGAR|nr:hypothetical protein B0H16DRAFT_1805044 [Mycena metata]
MSTTRQRKKKSGNDDDDERRKRRGNQGDFHGQREEFLRKNLQAYMDASEAGTTRDFWPDLFFAWWKKFPWWLSLKEEPTEDMELEGRQTADKDMTEAQKAEKRDALDKMEKKIKAWFNYQRGLTGGSTKNPWALLLKELRRLGETPAPKRLADFQCYMQQPDHREKIQKLFVERHPDKVNTRGHINERAGIARELLAQEDAEVQKAITTLADAEHELAMKEWKEARNGTGELDEDEKKLACERWAVTVGPLLKILSEYTGYHISLIVGRIDTTTYKFDIRSLHEGKTTGKNPQDWPQWAGASTYNDHVVRQFMRFLIAADAEPGSPEAVFVGEDPLEILRQRGIEAAAAAASSSTNGQNASASASTSAIAAVVSSSISGQSASSSPIIPAGVPTAAASSSTSDQNTSSAPPTIAAGMHGTAVVSSSSSAQNATSSPSTVVGAPAAAAPPPVRLPPAPSALDGMAGVDDALKRSVLALAPEACEERIAELQLMPEYFRRRQSGIAKSREDVEDAEQADEAAAAAAEAAPGAVNAGAKRKRGGNPKSKPGAKAKSKADTKSKAVSEGKKKAKKSKRKGPMGLDPSDSEEEEDDSARSEDEDAAATPPPREKHPRGAAGGEGMKAPAWASSAKTALEAGRDGGPVWTKLVGLWWAKEVSRKFKGPTRGHTEGRPIQVGNWIQYARKGPPKPAITDVEQFGKEWWDWWRLMNPNWRQPLRSGRLEQARGGEEWDSVDLSGPNGVLNAIICLRWWKDTLEGNEDEEQEIKWQIAVEEVIWVIEAINADNADAEMEDV